LKLLASSLCALCAVAAAVSEVPAAGIDRLNQFMSGTLTATGEFEQRIYNRERKLTQESRGSLAFSRPGKFRWTYSKPYSQLIVGDGTRVWVYDEDLNQVTVRRLDQALGATPAAATDSAAVIDYRDWHVPLGRRFRALKLWGVIRWYGAEGLRAHIRRHVALAQEFASWVADDERFELVAPHPLALVTFRLRAGDDQTLALMRRVNGSGELYLSHTAVNGKTALRLAIGSPLTERYHIEAAWRALSAT